MDKLRKNLINILSGEVMQHGRTYHFSRRIVVMCLAGIFSSVLIQAQTAKVDSLQRAYSQAKHDTSRVLLLMDIYQYYWYNGQMDSALQALKISTSIAEKIDDKRWLCQQLTSLGSLFYSRGYYDSSYTYLQQSLGIAKKLNDNYLQARVYAALGNLYTRLEQYEKAMYYKRLNGHYAQILNNSGGVAWSLANTASDLRALKKYDSALHYTFQAFEIRKKLHDTLDIARSMVGIGETLVMQGKFQEGLHYLDSAIPLLLVFAKNTGFSNLSRAYCFSAMAYKHLGNLQLAESFALRGLSVGQKYELRNELRMNYENLAEIYADMKKYSDAWKYIQLSNALKDSLLSSKIQQNISVMEIARQTEEQERALEEERRVRNVSLGGLGAVCLIAAWLGWLYRAKNRANDEISHQAVEIQLKNTELQESLETLRRTQTQLAQAEKMASLGTLVAGVAHELNTPIGVAVTAASTLHGKVEKFENEYKSGGLKKSSFEAFMENAKIGADLTLRNLERAANLIQSFKQVAVDQTSDSKRVINLKHYLEGVITSLEPKWKTTRHRVEIECDQTIELETYPGAIAQIITNLVTNSLLHGFEGYREDGLMKIVVERDGGRIKIEYSDNGRGISPEVLPRIFDPFFTTKQAQGGTGLGMHIVYNLVTQKLGGEIRCISEQGVGTTFIFQLPAENRLIQSRR